MGLGVILPIVALVDIVKNDFKGNNKIVWVLIVIFFNLLGSILYFTPGKKQRVL
ncbi:PLDc N-terminal domain-containing protein [Leeuwenhoekiella sp. W20_SRS_FM14]|uniref:PLDc N-terminal domain-containing protein n=1 Tax=Leeuwenhoekiella sp. W20_SRS_FM14 TaxID=3240270 RepID=UPI003F9D8F3E